MTDTHDRDDQDQSEVFDEENQTDRLSGAHRAEMRTFEELPEVPDLTAAEGDEDDDEALIAEDLDDDEIIALAEAEAEAEEDEA